MIEPVSANKLQYAKSYRRKDDLRFIVHGEGVRDEFVVNRSELARFCWSALADLCPDEAQQAASESGVDLVAMTAGNKAPRQAARYAHKLPEHRGYTLTPGGNAEAVLGGFLAIGRPCTLEEATDGMTFISKAIPANAVGRMVIGGLLRRTDSGGRFVVATYEATPLGAGQYAAAQSAKLKKAAA